MAFCYCPWSHPWRHWWSGWSEGYCGIYPHKYWDGVLFGKVHSIRGSLQVFLMIQGGVWSRMLSCILFREIFDSLSVHFIRRQKGFIDFSFFFQDAARIKSWGHSHKSSFFRQDLSFVLYWRASFSHISFRGVLWAPAYKLSIGKVRKAPKTCLRPYRVEQDLLADLLTKIA